MLVNNTEPQSALIKKIGVKHGTKAIKQYEGSNWRKAFTFYLDGVWSQNNRSVEGVIFIDNMVLQLHHGEYQYRHPSGIAVHPRPQWENRSQIHAVMVSRDQLELGLVKFIRNNQIRMLVLMFGVDQLTLWKSPERTELFCTLVPRTF